MAKRSPIRLSKQGPLIFAKPKIRLLPVCVSPRFPRPTQYVVRSSKVPIALICRYLLIYHISEEKCLPSNQYCLFSIPGLLHLPYRSSAEVCRIELGSVAVAMVTNCERVIGQLGFSLRLGHKCCIVVSYSRHVVGWNFFVSLIGLIAFIGIPASLVTPYCLIAACDRHGEYY